MNSMLVLGHLVVLEVEVHLALVHRHCLEPIEVAAWVLPKEERFRRRSKKSYWRWRNEKVYAM